jgi:hypothetical protein
LDIGEPFKLAMVTKTAKQLSKDLEYSYQVNGVANKTTVEKNTWCVTLRFLHCTDESRKMFVNGAPLVLRLAHCLLYYVFLFTDGWAAQCMV